MRKLSPRGLRFIETWEEFVPYVYDDKAGKRRINGRLQYPEWDGARVRGTLTIGFGHTDAAGAPKIRRGLRITREQANEILAADLAPCIAAVRDIVTVPLTQGQFDALVSFAFNCGIGNLRKLVRDLNRGDYASVPRRMMLYVTARGADGRRERMAGLVNRRAGEIALWHRPDDVEDAHEIFSPKATANAPPKSIIASKTANASLLAGAGGAVAMLSSINEIAGELKSARDHAVDLGLGDVLAAAAHAPMALVALLIVAAAAFVWWDRRRKLEEEHV
jgi:lysozyme